MLTLSFDLGEFNAQSAWYSLDDQTGEVRRGRVLTTSTDLAALLEREQPDRVLCEACAMACLASDVVTTHLPNAAFVAASTNDEAWRWSATKRKTDDSDAERLVRLDRLGELSPVALPDGPSRALRRLLGHRSSLVRRRTACYNAIRHACKQHEVLLPPADRAWSKAGLAALEKRCSQMCDAQTVSMDWDRIWQLEVQHLVEQVRMLNQQLQTIDRSLHAWEKTQASAQRLRTAPGIGPIVSAALLAFIGDPHRFARGRQVASYVGLVPRVFQSGASCRHGGITKSGNRMVRSLLLNAAWQAVRNDTWAAELFDRVCGGSKSRRKIAIVAVARQLVIRCWAMLRDQTSWAPPCPNRTAHMTNTVEAAVA